MEHRKTFNNNILIKLDKENDTVNGLFVDTTFDPDRHATVTGIIWGLPSHLYYSGEPNKGMPWKTQLEAKIGDGVIVYYLSIINALKPKEGRYIVENGERYVLIPYQFLYALVRDGSIIPINGYVLIEGIEDPSITREKERMAKMNMELIVLERRINNNVVFGRVKYIGIPNREYVDYGQSDRGVDVAVDDAVVIRKTNDVPLQYELHQQVNQGVKLFRVQRRNLLAKM
jgi:hypothetical protein